MARSNIATILSFKNITAKNITAKNETAKNITASFYQNNLDENYIYVEIKGEVKREGVYKLKENSRVEDLIKIAKLKNSADTKFNNLSKKLHDEDVVIIYSKEEINNFEKGNTAVKYVEKECICPKVSNISCFSEAITNLDGIVNRTGKISLNSGTIEEFMTLPGIGEGKAKSIIEYRDTNKGFKDISEITKVKGIGEAIFNRIKNYLTL